MSGVGGQVPDFVVIGVMKGGTTSLFRWLEAHPQVSSGGPKEPNFFSDDANFPGGPVDPLRWRAYQAEVAMQPDLRVGEASVRYTDPVHAAQAAERMATLVPDARLVCVLRDPVERLRSHYRYARQRAREARSLADALADPDNPYVRCSRYAQALRPYVTHFAREQLLVVRLDDLDSAEAPAWAQVLEHLGLDAVPRPADEHNVTTKNPIFSPLAIRLRDKGVLQQGARLPAPLRRLGRRLLFRPQSTAAELVRQSQAPIGREVVAELHAELAELAELLGWPDVPWTDESQGPSSAPATSDSNP